MNRFSKKIYLHALVICCTIFSINCFAQTPEELKTQMIRDWERAKAYTLDYANAMPADKYSLQPADTVKTFAQQMLHLAGVNAFFAGMATGQASRFGERDIEHSSTAQTKDSVLYFVTAGYDAAIENIKNTDALKFSEKVKAFNMELPRYLWLMKAFEHQTHHRGQTTVYLRIAGIKPPEERLF